jgi:phage I-like protein
MKTSTTLSHVILANPQALPALSLNDGAARSWLQLAVTGEFVSNRYGKFSITRADLAQMLHNFKTHTPKAPTELPIDYDHLSMDPKHPGDGIAAGWLKRVELRANGDELWGEVEWTPRAAEQIRNREYRFVSPSFVKDYTDKRGQQIGTTLIGAGITNHPFLESMKALTLYNLSAMGDLAVLAGDRPAAAVHQLADVGQRLTFVPDAERTPELTDEERGRTFVVKATIGGGDDQFVRLTTADGEEFGWFRMTQLAPAPAPNRMPAVEPQEVTTMSETLKPETISAARAFEQRVITLSKQPGRSAREAMTLAASLDEPGAQAYRRVGIATDLEAAPAHPPTLSLSVRQGESFDALCLRYSNEQAVPLREAIRAVSVARPDLLDAR